MRRKNFKLFVSVISLIVILLGFGLTASAKDRLVWRFSTDPPSIDPQRNNKTAGRNIIERLFEGLVRVTEDQVIVPGVAERWEINEAGDVYTFYLRKDAKWSDGQPITTKDFAYSWKRILQPEMAAPRVANFFQVNNAEEYFRGEVSFDEVGFDFVDDYTIVIELISPLPEDEVLNDFAGEAYYPLREDVVTANPDNWAISPDTIVGNGPWKMVSYSMNEELTIVKNEHYWDKANRALLDEIRFVFIDDSLTALRAFEAGEIDGFDGIPAEEIPRLVMERDDVYIQPRMSLTYFILNLKRPPLDNLLVREALVLAIDKEQIASVNPAGLTTPATGIIPYGVMSLGKDFRTSVNETSGHLLPLTGDIERAQAALAEAGYPNGEGFPVLKYLYNSAGTNTIVAEILQEMWKKNLGITVELENVEYKVESERRHSGDFDLARCTMTSSLFPSSLLFMHETGVHNNMSLFSDPDFDALVDAARRETDMVKRDAMYRRLEEWTIDEMLIGPLVYGSSNFVINENFKGAVMNPGGYVVFEYIEPNN